MGWETRGKQRYYYYKQRLNGKVVSTNMGIKLDGYFKIAKLPKDNARSTKNTSVNSHHFRKDQYPAMLRSPDPDSANAYRYDEKRTKLPTAEETAQTKIKEVPPTRLAYDPHLPPVLRSDADARAEVLLETASVRALKPDELTELAALLAHHQPWLEWAGKQEAGDYADIPIPPLHIHEFVAAEAIIRVARRQDVSRHLFSEIETEDRAALKSYQHETGWQNRIILGDSLQVMASLSARENLAGKVQTIYFDPPYGIKYASNFQSEVGKRDVKETDADLTREPEVVKAYRDTWTLGVHSYLAYLRDRLLAAKELLTDSGSIFVQISDENLHRVRLLMDEVFGTENFCSQITIVKTAGQSSELVSSVCDYLLWYARSKAIVRFRQTYRAKMNSIEDNTRHYSWVEFSNGFRRGLRTSDKINNSLLDDAELYAPTSLISQGATGEQPNFWYLGKAYLCGDGNHWKTNDTGRARLSNANRIHVAQNSIRFVRYLDDFPAIPHTNVWEDTATGNFTDDKVYVVQTNTKIVERCMLMTSDPGDLVLDPTCGSGTTAYVAEQWGRRWITIDTSRVAIAIARQRLLTAKFDYYTMKGDSPKDGFHYKSVPHITLKSIAQNAALDPVFAKWEPVLGTKLDALNLALAAVTPEVRETLKQKYRSKEKREKRNITDADRRRWLLPDAVSAVPCWREWEVPFDADEDYPGILCTALLDYRAAWRGKMDEVNAIIAASAVQENLVDQPKTERGILRVSGPFTVEGVIPLENSFDAPNPATPIIGVAGDLETFNGEGTPAQLITPAAAINADAYLDRMIAYLRADGVRFPDNLVMRFSSLEPVPGSLIQAVGTWGESENEKSVGVSFGPEVGSVTSRQVQECLRTAHRRGYDELVFAAFGFDAAAQALIQENNEDPGASVKPHLAHIAPSTTMSDLLKAPTPRKGEAHLQLFTVFGSPRVTLTKLGSGKTSEPEEFQVTMDGVDIYDPVQSIILPTRADRVAAWFLDSDYDGRSFCITQAFFPDKSAWEKIAKALKGQIDEERFAALSGTVSLPFPAGENRCAAVKVIDPRGNEVMKVVPLATEQNGGLRYGK